MYICTLYKVQVHSTLYIVHVQGRRNYYVLRSTRYICTLYNRSNFLPIDKVQGKEITIADPKNKMAPKTVLQKSDPTLAGAIQALVQPGAPK